MDTTSFGMVVGAQGNDCGLKENTMTRTGNVRVVLLTCLLASTVPVQCMCVCCLCMHACVCCAKWGRVCVHCVHHATAAYSHIGAIVRLAREIKPTQTHLPVVAGLDSANEPPFLKCSVDNESAP